MAWSVLYLDAAYAINLVVAILVIATFLLCVRQASHRSFKGLSKNISTYCYLSLIPMFGIPSISVFASFFYFTFDEGNAAIVRIERCMMCFCGYYFRISQVMICAERLHATFALNRSAKYLNKGFGYIMVLVTIMLTIICTMPWIIFENIYFFNSFVSTGFHLIVLFMVITLYRYNKRLHVYLAYKVDLKRRCQIVENIKTLKYVRPYLIIISTVAPIGPILIAILYLTTGEFAPLPVFYVFYNLAYFMCTGLFLYQSWKASWILRTNKCQISSITINYTVKNVFGKKIPADCNTEEYFINLNKFWNS